MKVLLLLFSVVILSSCDPSVKYERIIENQSSQAIWIYPQDSTNLFLSDSVLINSQSEYLLFSDSDIGGTNSQYSSCDYYGDLDTLLTKVDNSDTLALNFVLDQEASWIYTEIESGRNGTSECRLIITNSDID